MSSRELTEWAAFYQVQAEERQREMEAAQAARQAGG